MYNQNTLNMEYNYDIIKIIYIYDSKDDLFNYSSRKSIFFILYKISYSDALNLKSKYDDYIIHFFKICFIQTDVDDFFIYSSFIPNIKLDMNKLKLKIDTITSFSKNIYSILYLQTFIKYIEPFCFFNLYNLKFIILSKDLTQIGNNAFNRCMSLQNITIPSKVTFIGNNCFEDCINLNSITFINSVSNIRNIHSNHLIQIPFKFAYNCINLQHVINLPNSLTKLDISCFHNCYSLKNINLPITIKQLEINSFTNCTSLLNINIPNDLFNYKHNAFINCNVDLIINII